LIPIAAAAADGHRHMREPIHRRVIVTLSGETLTGGGKLWRKVMDATAFALARKSRMPIIVSLIGEPEAIEAVLRGKGRATVGT